MKSTARMLNGCKVPPQHHSTPCSCVQLIFQDHTCAVSGAWPHATLHQPDSLINYFQTANCIFPNHPVCRSERVLQFQTTPSMAATSLATTGAPR